MNSWSQFIKLSQKSLFRNRYNAALKLKTVIKISRIYMKYPTFILLCLKKK